MHTSAHSYFAEDHTTIREKRNQVELYVASKDGSLPRLLGSRCDNCGEVVFPAMIDCPACLGYTSMRRHELQGRGRLREFVVTQRSTSGFSVPYIQAYVRLDDGPTIFSMIDGCEPDASSIRAGDVVEMSIRVLRSVDGLDYVGWTFHPVGGD